MLVGAGGAVLGAMLLARMSPMVLATAVATVGGLYAEGVISVPAPGFVDEARHEVRAVQERSVTALACRQVVLRAADADDVVVGESC